MVCRNRQCVLHVCLRVCMSASMRALHVRVGMARACVCVYDVRMHVCICVSTRIYSATKMLPQYSPTQMRQPSGGILLEAASSMQPPRGSLFDTASSRQLPPVSILAAAFSRELFRGILEAALCVCVLACGCLFVCVSSKGPRFSVRMPFPGFGRVP